MYFSLFDIFLDAIVKAMIRVSLFWFGILIGELLFGYILGLL